MSFETARLCAIGLLCFLVSSIGLAQTTRQPQKRRTPAKSEAKSQAKPEATPAARQDPTPEPSPEASLLEQQDIETLKIATDLVTVPVIATDINGIYAPDLTKEEFSIWEDGAKQEIAFFTTVSAPFHVVLMLDTSASTREKLMQIQRASVAFVEQLKDQDRVKVISFDDQVRDLNDFTSDRATLRSAIYKTQTGQGTKLYDAFELALNSIRRIQGRKAIVLFTDGMDWHSDRASFDSTLRGLDEEGVIVYPIRYETRAETERLARQQAEDQTPQLPTIGVIRAPSSGTTAPTFPSEDPNSVPTSGTRSRTGPFGLPLPEEILRRRREGRDRDRDRYPPAGQPPDASRRPDVRTDPGGGSTSRPDRRNDDSIAAMLDAAYLMADSYLKELERKSGGRLLRADTLGSLPEAFAKIAAELRTQYALGYYPSNRSRDGKYRKIKVGSTRKNVVIRSRPGYLASSGS